MSLMLITFFEALILASSLSLDAFVASFAYGSNKIKIPMLSVQIINIVCSSILGVSLMIGSLVRQFLPGWLTIAICFTTLFILGIVKLFDCVTKSIIRKYNDINKELRFSMFNFHFILNLYANPVEADVDYSKVISPTEAVSLAIALSLDGMAVGFGAALGNVNGWAVFFASLIANALAVVLGCYIGNKMADRSPFDLSWLSGFILIGLAVVKLF